MNRALVKTLLDRAVPWMEVGGRPPYYAVSGGASSRAGGSLNVRISSQIALFPSLLIPGRQQTAVGFKIPAPRVAIYDLPDSPLIRLMKVTRIRPKWG